MSKFDSKEYSERSSKPHFNEALVAVVIQLQMETARWAVCSYESFQIKGKLKIYSRMWGNFGHSAVNTGLLLSVLITPDGKSIRCIGVNAEHVYEELEENDEHGQFYYFRNIVLKLLKAFKENGDIQLQDENGKTLPALTVFTLLLNFFINDIQEKAKEYRESDKHYVIVVPEMFQVVGAIDFIRKSALEAGINVKMLTVVTEIDAVSLFHQRESGQYKQNTQSSHGKKFVIINAGDYSSSIVAHETTNEGIVKESTALETKEGGGSILKKTFKTFCTDVFDTDVFTTFKSESNREWWEMKTELFKKAFSYEPSGSNITRLKLPVILQESFKQYFCLHESSVKSKYPGRIYLLSDKICFDSEVLQAIIKPSVEQVISDIQNYLKTKDASVDEIVVFGEFTTLPMFTYEVENQFSEKKVIFYEDEKESALTGAGIIGLGLGQIEKIDRVANTAIVAAIDFGTTYSGWAYSLRSNFDSDRTKASTKLWNSGSAQTEKTPTCILIRPDGKTIEAFGYEAEDRYQDLAGTEEHIDFFYFRRFKMSLSKNLGEDYIILYIFSDFDN